MILSQHGAYIQGNTHPTMVGDSRLRNRKVELILKPLLSSDCGLQLAHMKSELVVIAGQQTAVNTFSDLVHTARQASKVGRARTGIS